MQFVKITLRALVAWPTLLFVFAVAGGCAGGIRSNTNIVYTLNGDKVFQAMDIYSPDDSTRHPIVLMIHGGDWTTGDKADPDVVGGKMPWFVNHGYVFVSMNYHLRADDDHPNLAAAQVIDVASAMQFLFKNAPLYGGDSTRILLMGHDSGAYLAAVISSDTEFLQSVGMDSKGIAGTLLIDPPALDLPAEMPLLQQLDPERYNLYKTVFGDDITKEEADRRATDPTHELVHAWQSYSPLYWLNKDRDEVPYFIALSGDESAGPDFDATRVFTGELRGLKIPVKYLHYGFYSHQSISDSIGKQDEQITKDVTAFFANPAGFASGTTLQLPEY